jgi:hypothetical protein
MSKSNAFELDWLEHFFQNAAIAGVGDATGLPVAATAGSLYISLHSADPGEAGTQLTSELAYSGYARVAVARNNTAWVITTAAGSVSPAANIEFATSGGSGATAHFFGVGYTSAGTGVLAYSGTVSPAIAISAAGIKPILTTATAITED